MNHALAAENTRRVSVPLVAAALLLLGTLGLLGIVSARQAGLFIVGGLLGLSLYHASFGFTSAWRGFIRDRRGAGLRAQMIMLAVAVLLFFPALGQGTLWGYSVEGFVSPLSVSVLVGAFIFGIGMQMGGGCASGTLFTVGGGNARMLVTMLFFIIGSVIATQHLDWWFALPGLKPISLVNELGVLPAIVLNLVVFAGIYALTLWAERRRHGQEAASDRASFSWKRLCDGPWPLIWGALALAVLNFATLALAGRPWGVTSAFALWGAKAFQGMGGDVTGWAFWQAPANAAALANPVWDDITSVMNVGVMLGALLAAGLAGKFAPNLRIPLRSLLAAVLGGLLLGYGARLAYGCNIGAYFSGIASGSLHGWLWVFAAFFGNAIGVRIRPFFFPAERVCAKA